MEHLTPSTRVPRQQSTMSEWYLKKIWLSIFKMNTISYESHLTIKLPNRRFFQMNWELSVSHATFWQSFNVDIKAESILRSYKWSSQTNNAGIHHCGRDKCCCLNILITVFMWLKKYQSFGLQVNVAAVFIRLSMFGHFVHCLLLGVCFIWTVITDIVWLSQYSQSNNSVTCT